MCTLSVDENEHIMKTIWSLIIFSEYLLGGRTRRCIALSKSELLVLKIKSIFIQDCVSVELDTLEMRVVANFQTI